MALERFASWRVQCDGTIPPEPFATNSTPCFEEIDWSFWTQAEAQEQARAQGWSVTGKRALCPECLSRNSQKEN